MILASELRIGNLIMLPPLNRIGRVIDFTERIIRLKLPESIVKATSNKGVKGLDVEPIQITESFLLKFGFYKSLLSTYNSPYSHNNNYHIVEFKDMWIFRGLGASVVQIKYVHDLQNLYYSLTKEELTIK